jgi:2-phosphosulfolactate phosphatase
VNRAHQQADYRVRFDWGSDGATAVAAGADVAVLVDVLSFTTTLSVALDRGIVVLPYRWQDSGAEAYARDHGAVLAVGRSHAGLSLSPAAVRAYPDPPARLVLPSPNGSALAHQLGTLGLDCVGACLRNAAAVAAWLDGHRAQTVAVIAAGERWPAGGLRPAVEDAWGAGAVLTELRGLGWRDLSPEAEFAQACYEHVRGREASALSQCASGRELVERGFGADVEIAAELDQSGCVPWLRGGQFIDASTSAG